MDFNDNKLLIKIAEMYYLENLNQSEISKKLNIHRTTISRLLKKTRDEGIVNISINYDLSESYSLEKQLQEKLHLKKAIVVPTAKGQSRDQKDLLLVKGLNNYLRDVLSNGLVIGLSWGETVSKLSYGLSNYNFQDTLCVPMIGGPSGKLKSDYHVNTITYEVAKKLNAQSVLIDSPAFPETLKLKKALMQNEHNQRIMGLWRKIDVAIMGIGSSLLRDNETWEQFYGNNVLNYLEKHNFIGDVVSRFFDHNGKHIKNELDDRIIGIDITDLKRAKYKIGIAESSGKSQAIISAINGEYINVIVTTEETAKCILEQT